MNKYQGCENYLLSTNNPRISDCSSEMPKGEAANVFTSVRKDLWITGATSPPHYLTVDLSSLFNKPKLFNLFGFDCWHDYETNPAVIEILYANFNEPAKFQSCGRFQSSDKIGGWQFFRIPEVSSNQIRLLKVVIHQTHEHKSQKTYLNQIFLGYEQTKQEEFEKLLPPKKRQKINSQYLKLTSTEKELKRMAERMKSYESENDKLKNEVHSQNIKINKMQDTINLLFTNMQKMQRIIENTQKSSTVHELKKELLPTADFKPNHHKKYSRKNSETSSEMSIYQQTNQQKTQAMKNTKIANLLESLQEKLMLKMKMQNKLKSPAKHQHSSQDEQYD